MSTSEIHPLTLSTVWHSLQRICREMRRVIERTSQSYLISQLKDISVGIWGTATTSIRAMSFWPTIPTTATPATRPTGAFSAPSFTATRWPSGLWPAPTWRTPARPSPAPTSPIPMIFTPRAF
ncbi:MAG: hydantoinase B/oxoprolinase family protein [Deltaproteobacteria bacterium]|nr:hydantoinase B/oxoprolinase family protein [Deltaproteobacteria bacterium]